MPRKRDFMNIRELQDEILKIKKRKTFAFWRTPTKRGKFAKLRISRAIHTRFLLRRKACRKNRDYVRRALYGGNG